MLRRLSRWLAGFLVVEVRGRRPERFLSDAAQAGIELWDVAPSGQGYVVRVALGHFFALRPHARRAGCRLRIRRRRGLPFLWVRVRRRRSLLAGLALGAAMAGILAGHVWVVQVQGLQRVDRRAVLYAARQLGLKPGTWKGGLDRVAIEKQLPFLVPELAWAAVEVKGTRAVLSGVEKVVVRPPLPPDRRSDLVARREALVTQVVVWRGKAAVREGDAVQAGQALIEGVLERAPPPAPQGKEPLQPLTVAEFPAEGSVRGRVWYREYWEFPTVRRREEETGRMQRQLVLAWGPKRILLWGKPGIPFPQSRSTSRSLRLSLGRKMQVPVEVTYSTARELRVHEEAIPVESLHQAALERMQARLAWQLRRGDVVESVQAEVVQVGPHFAGIAVTAQTTEELTMPDVVFGGIAHDTSPGEAGSGR